MFPTKVDLTISRIGSSNGSNCYDIIDRNSSVLQKYDDAIARLQERRDFVTKIVAHQKSLVSPIRRLPPDILGSIFGLVAEEPILLNTRTSSQCTGAILPSSWVCSWWRNLILHQPTLWSRIDFRLGPVDDNSEFTSIVREVLLRSGPTTLLCLSLDLFETRETYPLASSGLLRILRTLKEHTTRWKDLKVHVKSFSDLDKL
ncbi:hypothetical protein BT96DRAFT_983222 [Gymnopus androsaceus JB14]|uniref:Uncharacterized protein n=1 Tax=Gymnopus androsaceus JB14 TaxID=1447944 RepID=A0A6A4IVR9_9AGAR|nr:hypothetical protein BT96DRAFT_983222 [Gymnopus androsaceus JB14]